MGEDVVLYKELLGLCGDISKYTEKTKTFPTQLSFNTLNEACFDNMYCSLKQVLTRQDLFPIIPELKEECGKCWKFYLSPRNNSIKILDIQLGKMFQNKLIEFFNKKGIDCRPGDGKKKIYPDNAVYVKDKIKAYLEIKYQSAPWIFAFKEHGRECYEGSPALDIKKLEQQFELFKSGEITAPIYYVYWLDFPCIKGIFFISIEDMHNFFINDAKVFNRKIREGDIENKKDGKIKIAAVNKIHPSLLSMKSFKELIGVLK